MARQNSKPVAVLENLNEHPATQAWMRVQSGSAMPPRIDQFKRRGRVLGSLTEAADDDLSFFACQWLQFDDVALPVDSLSRYVECLSAIADRPT